MDFISQNYDQLVNLIIRPPRHVYDASELGPKLFYLNATAYKRVDFELVNPRGLKLFCSQYYGVQHRKQMPVVIYCHGNAGCRLDADEILRLLLPMDISVVTFDCAGSGISEGEYVSLGYYEQHDLATVVEHLRSNGQTTRLGLWGRSMGSVTSLMFGASDPSIACLILDSPFSSLKTLATELVDHLDVSIPKSIVNVGFKMLKSSIEKKANFNIENLELTKKAKHCFIPALFAHASGDDFILPSHSELLKSKYAGDCNRIVFEGDHNTPRPRFFYDSAAIFISNSLLVDADFGASNPMVTEEEGGSAGFTAPTNSKPSSDYCPPSYAMDDAYMDDEDEQLKIAIAMSLLDTGNASASDPSTPHSPGSKSDRSDKSEPNHKRDKKSKDKAKKNENDKKSPRDKGGLFGSKKLGDSNEKPSKRRPSASAMDKDVSPRGKDVSPRGTKDKKGSTDQLLELKLDKSKKKSKERVGKTKEPELVFTELEDEDEEKGSGKKKTNK